MSARDEEEKQEAKRKHRSQRERIRESAGERMTRPRPRETLRSCCLLCSILWLQQERTVSRYLGCVHPSLLEVHGRMIMLTQSAATQAGEEGNWLQDNMEYFKNQAKAKGDEDFAALVKEVEEREDLKALVK